MPGNDTRCTTYRRRNHRRNTIRPKSDTRKRLDWQTRWLFVCIGGIPHTEWAIAAEIQRDEAGYLLTGADLRPDAHSIEAWPLDRAPYSLETNIPGLFAAGDVRHGSVKRCASAVGEGAMAVTLAHRYLATGYPQVEVSMLQAETGTAALSHCSI